MEAAPHQIVICDDHALFREGLEFVLSGLDAKISSVSTGAELLDKLSRSSGADLVLLDLQLPDLDGWSLLRRIRDQYPTTSVIVVSATEEHRAYRRAFDLGAQGYVGKGRRANDLRAAVSAVLLGGMSYPEEMNRGYGQGGGSETEVLTERQREVLLLVKRGLRNDEIASTLGVSVSTVKSHLHAAFVALGVETRSEAVFEAEARGLLDEG